MRELLIKYSWYVLVGLALFFSASSITLNLIWFKYPGNNYFPPNTSYIALFLALIYCGLWLQNGKKSKLANITKEIIFFYGVMALITFITNAAQFTPFTPIDEFLLKIDYLLPLNLEKIMAWTHTKPYFKQLLEIIYDTLPYQMCFLPLIVIISERFHLIHEYYFLLIITAIIGYGIYYFFPTTAPASVIDSNLFSESQKATGLKFQQIHQYISPTTLNGGMVAFPSFHVIWALLCLYLIRDWPIAFFILLPINTLLIISCVFLGWHYSIDLLGSALVIILAKRFSYELQGS